MRKKLVCFFFWFCFPIFLFCNYIFWRNLCQLIIICNWIFWIFIDFQLFLCIYRNLPLLRVFLNCEIHLEKFFLLNELFCWVIRRLLVILLFGFFLKIIIGVYCYFLGFLWMKVVFHKIIFLDLLLLFNFDFNFWGFLGCCFVVKVVWKIPKIF